MKEVVVYSIAEPALLEILAALHRIYCAKE
jgi:hypothetical protein